MSKSRFIAIDVCIEGYKSRPDLEKKMDKLNKKEFWFMKKINLEIN